MARIKRRSCAITSPPSFSRFYQKGQSLSVHACGVVFLSLSSGGSPLGLSPAPRVEISHGTTDLRGWQGGVGQAEFRASIFLGGKGWGEAGKAWVERGEREPLFLPPPWKIIGESLPMWWEGVIRIVIEIIIIIIIIIKNWPSQR